ncbi:glycosyltransferase family 4 protein [Aequorivita echinoideorum]|uniref:Glycosyltransferase n=1 Tax=Aequorivita echinoideorum TaxID=1549647 RepID=A0ABS5S655_9FLAO|nr:glycosyltransferase [Aequorivita echinoideorum]MBT0608463.1 glycosyltransferase [Aequorivita echinoideorum]
MRLLIVTHTVHILCEGKLFAYAPYVREMDLWMKHAQSVEIVAPIFDKNPSEIMQAYKNQQIDFSEIAAISLVSISEILRTIVKLPAIFISIISAMKRADHIHLRCPGNIGLIGCLAQLFFPKKTKTAKYAGNWDPKAKQPLSYRFQKWILSNTFLTKNMQVLVYGNWPNQSKNVKPFFTATYPKSDPDSYRDETETKAERRFKTPFQFMFVGMLSAGKQPLYAVKLLENLQKKGIDCELKIYGEGPEREIIEHYIFENNLDKSILLFGNQNSETIKQAYQQSDFLLLPSKSEGWPKVVAEAMYWGVVPIATAISCVPWMLDNGERGILLEANFENDLGNIKSVLENKNEMDRLSANGKSWSRKYTLEYFDAEIQKLLK